MKILILTDIFGKTSIPNKLISNDVTILEPYNIDSSISDEKILYENFLENCGHENYFHIALEKTKELKPDFIIGFSVGGTVAYRLSQYNMPFKTICFYPSQIRNHLHIVPAVETVVVFPKKEEHFDLEEIKKTLEKKNVDFKNSTALHGFMNTRSKNYNKKEQDKYIKYILKTLKTSSFS